MLTEIQIEGAVRYATSVGYIAYGYRVPDKEKDEE